MPWKVREERGSKMKELAEYWVLQRGTGRPGLGGSTVEGRDHGGPREGDTLVHISDKQSGAVGGLWKQQWLQEFT